MTYNEITMVPVTTILQTVVGSCDFDRVEHYDGDTMDEQRTNFWIDVIRSKARDTGFGDLINSILEHGFTEGSAIGWESGHITEGHHRLVAAILLGMDEVPCHPWGQDGGHAANGDHGYFSAHGNYQDPKPIEVEF